MTGRAARGDGVVAALPIAAALTLLLARWLPVSFEYRPNPLGIVSLATLRRYPHQQETFWLVFAVAAGSLLAWLLARRLEAPALEPRRRAAVEALGAASLLAVLWLPAAPGTLLCLLAALGALLLAQRGRAELAPAAPAPSPPAAPGASVALLALLLALALTPGVWTAIGSAGAGVPDEERTRDSFVFLSEMGQHLAWADALRAGGLHGRDFFCLYGPFYDLALVGLWSLLGRSIAVWDLYVALAHLAGTTGLLLLGAALLRRRAWLLAVPLVVTDVNLRVGLPLFGLFFLGGWLRGRRLWSAGLAGATGGAALLYSQEFGLALLVSAGLLLGLHRELRPALVFAAALAAVVAPTLAWYAAHDALRPMLGDLVAYPRYMAAGYGKIPFPALLPSLPLDPADWHPQRFLALRLGYALPAICLGGLLLALPVSALDPRRPLASAGEMLARLRHDSGRSLVAAVAVFGLLCSRASLGRSDIYHVLVTLPAAGLLCVRACEATLGLWRGGAPWRPLLLWRTTALALLVAHAGLLEVPRPLSALRRSAEGAWQLLQDAPVHVGSRHVTRVARWIQLHTDPGEPVLFLPNDAGYYYLTERPSPIRFVSGHQIVTEAHRREVLEALTRDPPRYIVWDDGAYRVDGIDDELVFGRALLEWIDARYQLETRIGAVDVLRLRGDEPDRS